MGLVSDETYRENTRINSACGVPFIGLVSDPHDTPLAVVGGGPSAARHLDELHQWPWPGEIWAINQSAAWLAKYGITNGVWMFTVDPDPVLAGMQWIEGVERAILGTTVDPILIAALRANGADVRLFHPGLAPEEHEVFLGGGSSVCRTFMPAMCLGYPSVTYFGCEGSLENGVTHWGRNEARPRQMVVRCGEQDFVTTPDLYLTTRNLAQAIRTYRNGDYGLREKSGGLLRGMIEHPDTWEVVGISDALADKVVTGDRAQFFTESNRYTPRVA